MTKYAQDYYEEYLERFSGYSDLELIEAFNGQVGNPGWGVARSGYLSALRSQLDARGINRDSITDTKNNGVSYTKKVSLYVINGQKFIKPID